MIDVVWTQDRGFLCLRRSPLPEAVITRRGSERMASSRGPPVMPSAKSKRLCTSVDKNGSRSRPGDRIIQVYHSTPALTYCLGKCRCSILLFMYSFRDQTRQDPVQMAGSLNCQTTIPDRPIKSTARAMSTRSSASTRKHAAQCGPLGLRISNSRSRNWQ